jgi:hypothetical protein
MAAAGLADGKPWDVFTDYFWCRVDKAKVDQGTAVTRPRSAAAKLPAWWTSDVAERVAAKE